MATQYEMFNEITFEAYARSAISKSVLKERIKKTTRSKVEQSYSMLTDTMLYALSAEGEGMNCVEESRRIFQVQGIEIPVYGESLGQALSYLLPKDRAIILLHFFRQVKTNEIARRLKTSPSTVRRRRKAALRKLRDYLEAVP